MSVENKEYTYTGVMRSIDDGMLRCYRTKKDIPLQECMKCAWFNGFRKRTHPKFNDHVFCKYQSDDEKAYMEAIKNHKCPDCGEELTDYLIKDGAHKGHGRIVCNNCQKTVVMI